MGPRAVGGVRALRPLDLPIPSVQETHQDPAVVPSPAGRFGCDRRRAKCMMIVMSAPESAAPTTVGRTLELIASHGDRSAIVFGQQEWSFAALLDEVRASVTFLGGLDVGRGSVLAVLTGDSPRTFTLRWAGNVLGAAVLVVPDGLSPASLAGVLATCRADFLVADEAHRALGNQAAAEHVAPPGLRVDVLGELAPSHGTGLDGLKVQGDPGDLATIRLTGGSTGVPKAIPRLAAAPPYLSPPALHAWADTVQLLCTPVAHLAGTLAEVVLAAGGQVILQEGFDAAGVLAAIPRFDVTWVWLQPRYLHRLLDHPDLARSELSSLRSISLGSAPSSPHRLAEAIERLGPIISSGYGTQEANQVTWLSAEEHTDPELRATVGRPVPGVEVSVRTEAGDLAPTGITGEILVRGPALVEGYLNAPEETDAAFDPEGWFHTGDLGFLDQAGYLSVVGRAKDVILAEHDRVYPGEVEETLLQHPDVSAAAVFGLADPDGVENVAAAVVPRLGRIPSEKELRDWVADRGREAMAPDTIRLLDQLPTTSSAKVDHSALAELFAG